MENKIFHSMHFHHCFPLHTMDIDSTYPECDHIITFCLIWISHLFVQLSYECVCLSARLCLYVIKILHFHEIEAMHMMCRWLCQRGVGSGIWMRVLRCVFSWKDDTDCHWCSFGRFYYMHIHLDWKWMNIICLNRICSHFCFLLFFVPPFFVRFVTLLFYWLWREWNLCFPFSVWYAFIDLVQLILINEPFRFRCCHHNSMCKCTNAPIQFIRTCVFLAGANT